MEIEKQDVTHYGITLKHQYDKEHSFLEMRLHRHSSLTEVLEEFESFLKAVGYEFKGTIEIVEEEDYNNEEKKES